MTDATIPKGSSTSSSWLSALALALLTAQCNGFAEMPEPRELRPQERDTLVRVIEERFGQSVPNDADFRAAGSFRFVDTERFHYMERTDINSVIFENVDYGVSDTPLEPADIRREVLLPRIERALLRSGLEAEGRRFTAFQDEFAGSAERQGLSIRINPRSASTHVARTAEFARSIDGVPVFGSELLVGLMSDSAIGRLRLHWPPIGERARDKARGLQRSLRTQTWTLPEEMRSDDIEILEVAAGIGHSGISAPDLRVEPAIRITYRRTSKDPDRPLASTGQKFFDASGDEITFQRFPEIEGTPRKEPERR